MRDMTTQTDAPQRLNDPVEIRPSDLRAIYDQMTLIRSIVNRSRDANGLAAVAEVERILGAIALEHFARKAPMPRQDGEV